MLRLCVINIIATIHITDNNDIIVINIIIIINIIIAIIVIVIDNDIIIIIIIIINIDSSGPQHPDTRSERGPSVAARANRPGSI